MGFEEVILGAVGIGDWVALGINLILSTIVGGIILTIIVAAAGAAWKEKPKIVNVFLMVFLINIINIFGVLGFLSGAFPMGSLIIPLLVWIGLAKLFLGIKMWHAVVIGLVGYFVTIYLVPGAVSMASRSLPAVI